MIPESRISSSTLHSRAAIVTLVEFWGKYFPFVLLGVLLIMVIMKGIFVLSGCYDYYKALDSEAQIDSVVFEPKNLAFDSKPNNEPKLDYQNMWTYD